MIKHIDDRDRWQFKIEGSKEFHAALASYKPWSFEQWKEFLDDPSDELGLSNIGILELKNEGAAILRAHEQNVKSVVAGSKQEVTVVSPPVELDIECGCANCAMKEYNCSVCGGWQLNPTMFPEGAYKTPGPKATVPGSEFKGLSANCPPHLASDVGHELANQSGTFGLCWYQGRDGKAKVSLRSNGDYDVSAIAKSFGGGGHQSASGCEVEMSTLQGWLK